MSPPRMKTLDATLDLLDACLAGDRDGALVVLDAGANPNHCDENGNPAWEVWVSHPADRLSDEDRAEVLVAMVDAGLALVPHVGSMLALRMEEGSPACAVKFLEGLTPEHLRVFLDCLSEEQGNDMIWWGRVAADRDASTLDGSTVSISTPSRLPRL